MEFSGTLRNYSFLRKYLHLLSTTEDTECTEGMFPYFLYSVFSVLSVVKLSLDIDEGIVVIDYICVKWFRAFLHPQTCTRTGFKSGSCKKSMQGPQ